MIGNSNQLVENLKQHPNIAEVAQRVKINAMIASSSKNVGVVVIGINPEDEKLVSKIHEAVYDKEKIRSKLKFTNEKRIRKFQKDSCGSYFKSKKSRRIIIGAKLAKKLKLKVRSKLVLTFLNKHGEITGAPFRVEGIFRTSNSQFDETSVFVNNSDLMKYTEIEANRCHEIAIITKNRKEDKSTQTQLESINPTLSVLRWDQILPEVGLMRNMSSTMNYVLVIIILFSLAFGIINTMLMAILERIKELGMLMAIGMNKLQVFLMIMLETVFLSLTGAGFGILFSWLLIKYYYNHGLDISAYAEGFSAIGYDSVIYPQLPLNFYIILTILVILTGLISSIFPSLKALKLKPAETIKE